MVQDRYRRSVSQLRPDATHYRREAHINKLESEAHLIRYAKAQIVLRDYWLEALKDTEYRIVEFVLRQTLAFNKDEDVIALDQFINGIGDRCGVGVSRSNVINAIKALGQIGLLLESHRYYGESHGRKASSFRVNLDMLFETRPTQELLDRRAGEGKLPRRGPHPAGDTRSVESDHVAKDPAPGPAGNTTLVLLARPDPGAPGPAGETHILKPIETIQTTEPCPQCLTRSWRQSETGETLCGLCDCERLGFPHLRPQVDDMLRKRGRLR